MIVIQWIVLGIFETLTWAVTELRDAPTGPFAVFTLPLALLILVSALTPLVIAALLLKVYDATRRAIRGY